MACHAAKFRGHAAKFRLQGKILGGPAPHWQQLVAVPARAGGEPRAAVSCQPRVGRAALSPTGPLAAWPRSPGLDVK